MTLKNEHSSNKIKELYKLSIDDDFTIFAIDAIKQKLSEKIDNYDFFELNLASVEEIDSAGIQLLLSFKKELLQNNKELKLIAISAPVTKLMEDYGVSQRFDMEI